MNQIIIINLCECPLHSETECYASGCLINKELEKLIYPIHKNPALKESYQVPKSSSQALGNHRIKNDFTGSFLLQEA